MTFSSFSPVFKAAPKARKQWKATRTRERLDALSKTMGEAVGVNLARGLRKFKGKIPPEKIYQAWLKRDYHGLMLTVPWQEFSSELEPGWDGTKRAYGEAWDMTSVAVPVPKNEKLRFDTENPRLRAYIASRKAQNFTNLTHDSARNIQGWVTRSFDQALSPKQVAQGIRDQIGLLPAHSKAVAKYKLGLLEAGHSQPSADNLSSEYANRLLDYRAMMIGRTETRLATNQGQLSVWRQAADEGLIDRTTTGKTWITAGPDPCEECIAMDGSTVPLDSPWILKDGDNSGEPVECPPLDVHPHCYCTFNIEYGLSPDDFDDYG